MFTSRVLRRRWVLAIIFICSLIYFLVNTFKQSGSVLSVDDYEVRRPLFRQPFEWQPSIQENNVNQSQAKCRNSVQGKTLIADERGYVCSRTDVLVGGCCNKDSDGTTRYSCRHCLSNGCCVIYEYCVSCCLLPDKRPLLRRILKDAQETFDPALTSVRDHFELCLLKCRTSSQSVQHENSYRDPVAKFCYGDSPPNISS